MLMFDFYELVCTYIVYLCYNKLNMAIERVIANAKA